MARKRASGAQNSSRGNGANLGSETQLWQMAEALRGSIDAAEYKHVVLGRVYEYFLSQFASAKGKKGGKFYTPRCVVRLLVEIIEPFRGRVYDPCCGSAGMFVHLVECIRADSNCANPPLNVSNGGGDRLRDDKRWRYGVLPREKHVTFLEKGVIWKTAS